MKEATHLDSGILPVAGGTELSPGALIATCHEILNAVSVLVLDVEFLAHDAIGQPAAARSEAADDARQAVVRVTEIVRRLQRAARESQPPGVAAAGTGERTGTHRATR